MNILYNKEFIMVKLRCLNNARLHSAIYWEATGINETGRMLFKLPVIVSCRWDQTSADLSFDGDYEGNNPDVNVLMDRICVVGSYLMKGDEDKLAEVFNKDPQTLPQARRIKHQDITPVFSKGEYPLEANYQSDEIVIFVRLA
jgi:hypothetical protein